jgi:2-methylisocitrate lyase-like PEP mutase family enzyme
MKHPDFNSHSEDNTMRKDLAAKRAAFRTLHESGHFVIPNPWDIGSAQRLEKLGFKALASTSAGYAWSLGRRDGELTLDEVLEHLRTLCAATDLPVNADFEAGFADQPDGVAASVRLAVETGVAGLSIEDRTGRDLYPMSLAVARIRASREAINESGQDVLLVGRTEGLLIGKTSLDETITRLVAYSNAGADVLYAPGIKDLTGIKEIVAAVAPKPVNVLLLDMNVADLAAAGVRRTSLGSAFAAAAWAGFEKAALSVRDEGRLPAARD